MFLGAEKPHPTVLKARVPSAHFSQGLANALFTTVEQCWYYYQHPWAEGSAYITRN